MHLKLLLALLSSLSFPIPRTSAQLITADNHSFGGVNYPLLQYFTPQHRDETIKAIVSSKARVIRLFIRPDSHHTDPEPMLGEFDKSLLDQLDDTLAAIHRISKGQTKVIIAPHDAHALRGSKDVPCDAYCEKINGAFLDFYSNGEIRKIYKTRLDVFFKHYPSKNFGGRSWSELSEVIMGVDIQNQPFSGIWPIPSGESWLCDIATHLKFKAGLDSSNIAVISGGVSGLQSAGGIQNFPDSVFDCPAVDVIGIHGRFAQTEHATAGTPWADMFLPGNTLTARAQGKQAKRKLLLVEEWEYVHTNAGLEHKKEAIFDQGNALNLRGIPWIYSHLSSKNESTTSMINPLRPELSSLTALTHVLTRASTARSNFNWTAYLPASSTPLPFLAALPLNPYIPPSSACVFGCEGHLCDAADGCKPDLFCKNSVCIMPSSSQPGKVGDACTSKKPCQPHLQCSTGACQACSPRASQRTTNGSLPREDDAQASCYADSFESILAIQIAYSQAPQARTCLPLTKQNPCETPTHCSADSYCSWGVCTQCLPGDTCLGAPCTSNQACKTGFCNAHARCDYAGQKPLVFGPGVRGRWKNSRVDGVPGGHERGPARVRDEAMRIVIEEEGPRATGEVRGVS